MNAEWLILSPLFPPARGGLADHTEHLAGALSAHGSVTVLTTVGASTAPSITVAARVDDWHNRRALLAAIDQLAPVATLLWQYVPHMYGRGGVNLALPSVLATLARRGRRQLVLAHEIAAPLSLWPQRFLYALAQRWQWQQLLRRADALSISTEAWLALWRRLAPQVRHKFFLLPTPSNIPRVVTPPGFAQQWRQAEGLAPGCGVVTYFGTISAPKQFSWVAAAWEAAQRPGRPVALVVIGDRPDWPVPASLAPLFKPVGFVAREQVSRLLQATDVLALPFIDGVSERRGSFMAGLGHGCAVATTLGEGTGPSLRSADVFGAAAATDRQGFIALVTDLMADEGRRRRLGAAATAAYEQRYDWPTAAARIVRVAAQLRPASG